MIQYKFQYKIPIDKVLPHYYFLILQNQYLSNVVRRLWKDTAKVLQSVLFQVTSLFFENVSTNLIRRHYEVLEFVLQPNQ